MQFLSLHFPIVIFISGKNKKYCLFIFKGPYGKIDFFYRAVNFNTCKFVHLQHNWYKTFPSSPNSLCFPFIVISISLFLTTGNDYLFSITIVFFFLKMLFKWNHTKCHLLRLVFVIMPLRAIIVLLYHSLFTLSLIE